MHRNVELLLGRLATDPKFLARFAADPVAALAETGLELTAIEVAALAATDPETLSTFATALDPRIRRATTAQETNP